MLLATALCNARVPCTKCSKAMKEEEIEKQTVGLALIQNPVHVINLYNKLH